MLVPQCSILSMLVSYYLTIYNSPFYFIFHLTFIYTLFFFATCSLMVCVARDPGMVKVEEASSNQVIGEHESEDENGETDILNALSMDESRPRKTMNDDPDFNAPHKWCRKCWAPKPVSLLALFLRISR